MSASTAYHLAQVILDQSPEVSTFHHTWTSENEGQVGTVCADLCILGKRQHVFFVGQHSSLPVNRNFSFFLFRTGIPQHVQDVFEPALKLGGVNFGCHVSVADEQNFTLFASEANSRRIWVSTGPNFGLSHFQGA